MNKETDFPLAADCHLHLFDPVRFPYATDAVRVPRPHETAPLEALLAVLDAHGISHALIVTPTSGYGPDNSAALDAIDRHPDRFRGIAVVRADSTLDELGELKARGFVGVRIDLMGKGVAHLDLIAPLLGRLNELDLIIQFQTEKSGIVALASRLAKMSGRIVIDHMGRPDAGRGDKDEDFRTLLALADLESVFVKLSGPFRFSNAGYPYLDADAFARRILRSFGPGRCVWGSDWPFVGMDHRLDYGPALTALERWCDDATERRRILWDTPRRLYGFDEPLP